jgi:hypothetical protein
MYARMPPPPRYEDEMNDEHVESAAPAKPVPASHVGTGGEVLRPANDQSWRTADTYDRQEIRDVRRIGAVDQLTAVLRRPRP